MTVITDQVEINILLSTQWAGMISLLPVHFVKQSKDTYYRFVHSTRYN